MKTHKHIIPFLLICVMVMVVTTITQAQKDDQYPVITITPNKVLEETEKGVDIVEGNCIVFKIKTSSGGDPRVDARVITSLVFQIPEDRSDFQLSEDDFKEKKAYVVISDCRCMDLGYNPVISGVISGTQQDDGSWEIDAEVTAKGKDSGENREFKYQGIIRDDSRER